VRRDLRAGAQPELLKDARQVRLDGLLAEGEPRSDLAVNDPLHHRPDPSGSPCSAHQAIVIVWARNLKRYFTVGVKRCSGSSCGVVFRDGWSCASSNAGARWTEPSTAYLRCSEA